MEPQHDRAVPTTRSGPSGLQSGVCAWLREFFAFGKIIGDVRSAVVASVIAAITTYMLTVLTPGPPLHFTVAVNSDGYGQPKGLFSTAEQADPHLKLTFNPPNLREAYVCEFKQVTGDKWQNMVLSYFDTYRECFDVSERGKDNYSIYPNYRSKRMTRRDGAYFCKCDNEAASQ